MDNKNGFSFSFPLHLTSYRGDGQHVSELAMASRMQRQEVRGNALVLPLHHRDLFRR